MRVLLGLLSLVALVGCTSLGPQFKESEFTDKKMSRLYVYRVKHFAGSAVTPYVCIDGQVVGESANHGYFSVPLAPGQHKMELKNLGGITGTFYFTTAAGQTYYARHDVSMYNGAKEAAANGTQAGLAGAGIAGGGGAIGGAMNAAAGAYFYASDEEKKAVLLQIDKRAQNSSLDAGLLIVKPEFAAGEIAQNQLFEVPKYAQNFCADAQKPAPSKTP